MQKTKRLKITNWGNFPKIEADVYRPERQKDLNEIINTDSGLTARGAGKSYGDASLGNKIINFNRLNKFINFDADNGKVTCQAGVTLAEILDISIPKGWFLPVIPGTKFVTVGGAIAGNVHGKNHYKRGDFCEYVEEIKLIMADGEQITCSASENSEIFAATCGGMGMTGAIKQATVKLIPIETISLKTSTKKIDNISEMLQAFKDYSGNSEYMVGWIDHFSSAELLGRGYFQAATHAKIPEGEIISNYKTRTSKISIPGIFPGFIMNKHVMRIYNKLKFFSVKSALKTDIKSFSEFFHPLDSIKNWNNLYGKRGFLQYQFIIPDNRDSAENLRKILETIQKSGFFSYLAVIKYHRDGKFPMSFPIKGYSVALDFKVNPQILQFLNNLDHLIAKLGGRIYLSKDSRMNRDNFEKIYWHTLPKWKRLLKDLDPNKKFISEMALRLGFKDYV